MTILDVHDQLSEKNYARLAEVLQNEVGIRLPSTKRMMVEGRLRKRVRSLGLRNLDEYCRVLFEDGELRGEFVHIIDLITTNKTDFFREPDHFDFLIKRAVPSLLESSAGSGERRLKIWSSACSNGAEPYTIALCLLELAQDLRFKFSILGTDISTDMLQSAVKAVYPEEMILPVPPELRERYILRARKAESKLIRIAPEIRRLVHFERLNLMDVTYPFDRDIDVIFCRNVLIYFEKSTQQSVLEKLCSHLRRGGYLFLGHSESAAGGLLTNMISVAPTVMRKK
jgi:chemotaxis protein methyltransferase CheR